MREIRYLTKRYTYMYVQKFAHTANSSAVLRIRWLNPLQRIKTSNTEKKGVLDMTLNYCTIFTINGMC